MTHRAKTRHAIQKEITQKIKEGGLLPAGFAVRVQVKETYRIEKKKAKPVVQGIARKFGTTHEEMCSKSRKRNVVLARAVSSTYLVMNTELPYQAIGEVVRDNPDHAIVIHYLNEVVPSLKGDLEWWPIVNEILYKSEQKTSI